MNSYLVVIVVSVVLAYALECVAGILTIRSMDSSLPGEFREVFDAERYARSQDYARSRIRLDMAEGAWGLALLMAAISLGLFNELDLALRGVADHSVARGLAYLGTLGFAVSVLHLPFRVYATFVLEARFGFNTTSIGTFLLDRIKGAALAALIGGPLMAAVLWFFESAGSAGWLYAWIAAMVVVLAVQYVAPIWILPLFNTFTPLEDGELRQAIESYARGQGFSLSGIFIMDGSRRSTKSNAFFTGFGSQKRIALFDTLASRHETGEIVAVLAHEVGHARLGHIRKMLASSMVRTGLVFFLLSLALNSPGMFGAFGLAHREVYTGLVVFSFLLTPLNMLAGPLFHAVSRRFERQADRFAAETTGRPQDLAKALKRLATDNLSNLTPHPLDVALHYSHPPVLERVRTLASLEEAGTGTA